MQRSLSVSAASWEPCRQLPWVICLKDKKKKHLPISSCAPLFESCHQNISSAILPGFHLISGAGENPRQKARRHSILKASAGTKSIKTHKKLCIQQQLTSEDWEGTMRGGIFDVPFVLNPSSPCIQVSKGILDQWINVRKHRQQRAQIKFRKRHWRWLEGFFPLQYIDITCSFLWGKGQVSFTAASFLVLEGKFLPSMWGSSKQDGWVVFYKKTQEEWLKKDQREGGSVNSKKEGLKSGGPHSTPGGKRVVLVELGWLAIHLKLHAWPDGLKPQ